jgi:HD-GYP domain-containing protein (c-di-GMP phosphodiesterase class II)
LTGYSKEELLDKHIWDLGFIKNCAENKRKFKELQETGYVRYENIPIETKQGARHYVEFISNSYQVASAHIIQCNIRDITNRVTLEKLNNQLAMMYQVILRCNEVLIHEATVSDLISQICNVLVSLGGFAAAWVACAPLKSNDLICPIAFNGVEQCFFDKLNLNNEKNEYQKLLAHAISSHQLQVSPCLQQDESDTVQDTSGLKHQFYSVAAIPVIPSKKVRYILVVHGQAGGELTVDICTLLQNLASNMAFGIDNLETHAEHLKCVERMSQSLNNTISVIASMVEQRDPYTSGHQRNVANLAEAISIEMGLAAEQIIGIRMACVVHDIGKIHVPAEIFSKPGALSAAEYEIIKTHPQAGWEVLKHIDFPWPIA